jgi:hypothetical protein
MVSPTAAEMLEGLKTSCYGTDQGTTTTIRAQANVSTSSNQDEMVLGRDGEDDGGENSSSKRVTHFKRG